MSERWRENLLMLSRQFEAKAAQSKGMFHLMVEAHDDHRDRLRGPDWFTQINGHLVGKASVDARTEKWGSFAFSGLPSTPPYFRAVNPEDVARTEAIDAMPDVIRDKKGTPRAVLERQWLRFGYYCGDSSTHGEFQSLAAAAATSLLSMPEATTAKLPPLIQELCRQRAAISRYQFGTLRQRPHPVTSGWDAVIYAEDDGVLIYSPEPLDRPSADRWLLLLYRLGWAHKKDSLLVSDRRAWNGSTSIPYDWIEQGLQLTIGPKINEFDRYSFYSTIGPDDAPTDLNLASVWGIHALLELTDTNQSPPTAATNPPEIFVSYSHADKKLKDEFARHVKPLEKYGTIKLWSDERIKPSDEWRAEIKAAMSRASMAVVLISANFLASDFCTDVELTEFLEARHKRGLKLVGVLLTECAWKHSPLAHLQLLPQDTSNNLKPIKSSRNRDKLWTSVVDQVAKLVNGP